MNISRRPGYRWRSIRLDLEIDLTPGVAIAERIISAIDLDRDGRFSP